MLARGAVRALMQGVKVVLLSAVAVVVHILLRQTRQGAFHTHFRLLVGIETDDRNPCVASAHRFELCFVSLFDSGRALAIGCDASGRVDLDAMSERARSNYFYARTVVGREFGWPAVRVSVAH